jgi:lipopolysaccharide/colanic/teichoic acid biosynthesis glycosyltransferase
LSNNKVTKMADFSSANSNVLVSDIGIDRRFDAPAKADSFQFNSLIQSDISVAVAKHHGPHATAPSATSIPQGVLESLDVPAYHDLKRIWEIPVALVLAIPSLLMTALLIVLVRATSKGPGIYAQERSGRHGKSFKMYKLRSMYEDAEARGAQWCAGEDDPRVTPVGRWLRKLHLDELPQIINVLRGDMSFCGPRPERPQFIEKLVDSVPYYRSRLTVRPGITGFAQINLPADSGVASVLKKQALDLDYVVEASIWADLKMIACTALRLIGVPGASATTIAGLTMTPDASRFSVIYSPLWEVAEKAESAAPTLTPELVASSQE